MAIDELLDEHEQSERVLQWLRTNGAGLIGGILLGLAAIGGWKWWEARGEQKQLDAATQYQVAMDAIEAKDAQAAGKVKALAQGDGIYHTLASLELAKSQVAANQRDAAIATLKAVHSDDTAIAEVVNLRLARLLIDAKQADAALKLVADATSPAAIEVRGDAQFALGRLEQARQSYTQAMTRLDVASPRRRLLELKLTEAGGTPPKTESQS